MTLQYNVPIIILDSSAEPDIQHLLKPYYVFTDGRGNLQGTRFSKEKIPYVGEIVVVKTLREDAALKAHEVLSGIEGLLVLPITTCDMEEDHRRVNRASTQEPVKGFDKFQLAREYLATGI